MFSDRQWVSISPLKLLALCVQRDEDALTAREDVRLWTVELSDWAKESGLMLKPRASADSIVLGCRWAGEAYQALMPHQSFGYQFLGDPVCSRFEWLVPPIPPPISLYRVAWKLHQQHPDAGWLAAPGKTVRVSTLA